MKYINVIDAKEKFSELVTLLGDPLEEVYLTFQGKPIIKMVPIKKDLPRVKEEKPVTSHRRRLFGIAKDKHDLPPDFDELFDAMDAEIWRDVADSYEVKK